MALCIVYMCIYVLWYARAVTAGWNTYILPVASCSKCTVEVRTRLTSLHKQTYANIYIYIYNPPIHNLVLYILTRYPNDQLPIHMSTHLFDSLQSVDVSTLSHDICTLFSVYVYVYVHSGVHELPSRY